MTICASSVSWGVGGKLIVDGVSVATRPGMTLGLLGPNGSGKSSLLRVLAGLRSPAQGSVSLDGTYLGGFSRREIAQRVAMVEQHTTTDIAVTVLDVVRLGRTPHRTALSPWTLKDDAVVERALERVELSARRHQLWHTLSGGERQRVQLARALAQEPTDLILDEPTNHLDIQHQLEILKLVARLPLTSIVALHDLNLAAMFCDELMVMKDGRVVAAGRPRDVLTEKLIATVFAVQARIITPPAEGPVHIQYLA